MKNRLMCGLGLVALLLLSGTVYGQNLDAKIQKDDVFNIPEGDPAMADAMKRARATLDDFLKKVAQPSAAAQNPAVKIGLREKNNKNVEFVWVGNLRQSGEAFTGTIGNRLNLIRSYKQGDTIQFAKSDIVDWMYTDGENRKGNYTSCVLLKREGGQEADATIKRLKLDCSWMR